MTPLGQLAVAMALFLGTHFALSHPLRAPLVARLGERGFLGVYSLVAFVTLGWAGHSFARNAYGTPLWRVGEGLWGVTMLLTLFAAVLLVGSFVRNPALPQSRPTDAPPRGVFRITRHPMMWGIALWALGHVLVSPRLPVITLMTGLAILALGGAAAQDAKKRQIVPGWPAWMARTSFVPFGRGIASPGVGALLGGLALWLFATFAHPAWGAPVAGIWKYVFA